MMAAIRSGRHVPKAAMLALFACALLLRLIVPAGWMPVSDARGIHVVICTGMGPVETVIAVPMAASVSGAHHGPADDHQAADHPCVFSGLGLALAEPRLPDLAVPPAVRAFTLVAIATGVTIGRGLAAPPPPATGPPLLA